jgi:uncharacterized protein YegJ (DUF2314 family)
MNAIRLSVVAGSIVIALCGCNTRLSTTKERVETILSDDKEKLDAMEKARASVDQMIGRLKEPGKANGFCVKKQFVEGSQVELMWLSNATFDGKVFRGRVANEPQVVHSIQSGSPASVSPTEILDWMYVEDGKLVGGYSIRAMYQRLSPAERAELDKTLPYRIE